MAKKTLLILLFFVFFANPASINATLMPISSQTDGEESYSVKVGEEIKIPFGIEDADSEILQIEILETGDVNKVIIATQCNDGTRIEQTTSLVPIYNSNYYSILLEPMFLRNECDVVVSHNNQSDALLFQGTYSGSSFIPNYKWLKNESLSYLLKNEVSNQLAEKISTQRVFVTIYGAILAGVMISIIYVTTKNSR